MTSIAPRYDHVRHRFIGEYGTLVNRPLSLSFVIALAAPLLSAAALADTLWTENAENGTALIIDGTTGGYSLIQSDVVGEGNYAFHLANPGNADNWFVLDHTFSIPAGTKLFFLSRLRYAGTAQHAKVQVSTNGGASWSSTIYDQVGTSTNLNPNPGEGAFSLKTINLGTYASARFRFNLDVVSGVVYSGTESNIGWFVDNIQIGDAYEKVPWSIGDPTPHEQLYLEYINRARASALDEADRLRDETDADIQSAYSSFGIDGQDIVGQFQWYVNNGAMDQVAQPLSFQSQLLQAARLHSQDLFENEFQGHTSSSNPPAPFQPGDGPGDRVQALGYSFQNLSENVYSYAESVRHGHAGFDVDWGNTTNTASPYYNPAFVGQGMQNPAGHRRTIHNDDFKEVGIGVINGTNGSVGPQLVTQDFGYSGDVRYITGVVYEDLNANDFYDLGEGRSGVRIDVDGSPFYALSSTSGGYSVPVSLDGTYSVTFSGGGFESFVTSAMVANGKNIKVDYLATALPILYGDYNDDGTVNAADYTVYRNRKAGIGGTTLPNDAGTAGVTIDDYNYWKAHYGETLGNGSTRFDRPADVPEPATLILWAVAAAARLPRLRGRSA